MEVRHGTGGGGGARRLPVVEMGHSHGGGAVGLQVVGQSLFLQLGYCHLYIQGLTSVGGIKQWVGFTHKRKLYVELFPGCFSLVRVA